MEPAADSPPADSDTIGNVSSLGAPQDSSVSDADNQWNRNEVNQTRLESVISDVRVTWERVSQKLNILTAWRRGPRVAMG